jgi:hypothetical protein
MTKKSNISKKSKSNSNEDDSKKVGNLPTWLVERAQPKESKTSELEYLANVFVKQSGLQSLGNILSSIQNKAYKNPPKSKSNKK